MSQLHTQSKKYSLDTVFFGESIYNWVDIIHSKICHDYEMPKFNISPCDYGFDSYVYVLSEILKCVSMPDIMNAMRNQLDMNKFVDIAHCAWTDNYIFWKNLVCDERTDNPKKSINTINRNERATTHSQFLKGSDLELYYDIINAVFEYLTKKILEAGMQNLSM